VTKNDLNGLRARLVAVAPVRVSFHGSPRNAPALLKKPFGYVSFRTWGRTFTVVAPTRTLTVQEHTAVLELVTSHLWDCGAGHSFIGGDMGAFSEMCP